ncbi:hypothetical protein NL676_016126 [Syzygium grande]|nr:hypothetical protein NL676_016126 [Syzygium grande]
MDEPRHCHFWRHCSKSGSLMTSVAMDAKSQDLGEHLQIWNRQPLPIKAVHQAAGAVTTYAADGSLCGTFEEGSIYINLENTRLRSSRFEGIVGRKSKATDGF